MILPLILALSAAAAEAPKKEVPPQEFYKEAALEKPRIAKARDVKKWLKEGSAVLLDVRSPESFKRSHIAGAKNLPGTELTTEAAAAVIPSTATRVVVYCDENLGPTRMIALTTFGHPALKKLGYADVWTLETLWNSKDCTRGKEWGFVWGCPRFLPMEGTDVEKKKTP